MFIGYYNLANFITLTGLASSLTAGFLALTGNYKIAIIAFLFAGVCDMFDGRVARRLDKPGAAKVFGIQIDTVCDMVSFGVIPGIIAFAMGFKKTSDIIIYILLAVCGGIRLAYFNTMALDKPGKKVEYFKGLPIPAICFVLPVLVLLMIFVEPNIMKWVFKCVYILTALAFIGNFNLKKPGLKQNLAGALIMIAFVFAIMFCDDLKLPA